MAHSNFVSFACIAAGALYAASTKFQDIILSCVNTYLWGAVVCVLTIGPLVGLGTAIALFLPILIVYLIFTSNALPWVRAILTSKPLQILGLGSYSLYLWQQLFLAQPDRYLAGPFNVALLPVVVVLSVWLIEKPFIRLGRSWSHRIERVAEPRLAG